MARNAKSADNLQVFRGSLPKSDVFAQNAGIGCCGPGANPAYDKLGERTRFDNALAHSNPTGANDKYRFPSGNGFDGDKADIVAHINAIGVGAEISVLAIPTYAFVTGLGLHVEEAEAGLTFDVVTRNGLVIPQYSYVVTAEAGATACEIDRTLVEETGEIGGEGGTPLVIEGIGALGAGELFKDYFYRDGNGSFALEADEIIMVVKTMPAGGAKVVGTFDITVAVSYDVIHRAER